MYACMDVCMYPIGILNLVGLIYHFKKKNRCILSIYIEPGGSISKNRYSLLIYCAWGEGRFNISPENKHHTSK